MRVHTSTRWRTMAMVPLLAALTLPASAFTQQAAAAIAAPAAAAAADELVLPDPMERGDGKFAVVQEVKLGTVALQEPNSRGTAPGTGQAQSPENLEIRGQLYYPTDRTVPSPVLVLVHGNHGSCDAGQNSATASCTQFKRNEAGYAYLAENLATWGYTTFSVSQDQLMMRQDGDKGKGMHQRRRLIAASLDALSDANAGKLADGPSVTPGIGEILQGKLDMTRIGLMGHSRGGDAVTSFIDYNRLRTDGPRYPLRGVIALAPVDYERKAPYGTPFMSILPFCDGDVSNLQGARFFERSQYINGADPFPRVQSSQLGSIHNWYNTVWYADGGADGQANNDAACGNSTPFVGTSTTAPGNTRNVNVHANNIRLSGAANPQAIVPAPGTTTGSQAQDKTNNYVIDNSDTYNPLVNTKISGDPARMGDQEKIGLATMASFFRRYVGGEGAFDPYVTGELSATDSHQQIPDAACPTSVSGTRIGCEEYVSTNYFPAATERVDVIRPEIENPLGLNALGGSLSGAGFVNPYLDNGAVTPLPEKTVGGYDWCNPEPDDFAPAQLGKTTQPTGAKACPLPGKTALGGQNGTRENSPVNHSYGRQLALAWEKEQTAELTADIPAASQDVSGLKALSLSADVNFFDERNPGASNRGDNTQVGANADASWPNEKPTSYDPASTTQDFLIVLKDTTGKEASVHAGDERWGNALHMSTGTNTANTHIVLDQIRVPLSEFADQGVDVTRLDELTLRFGAEGTPTSGSIQLADVRFQEAAVAKPLVLSDGTDLDQGAGHGPPATGPDPADYLEAYDVSAGNLKLIDTVADQASETTWVVDDDKAQCPAASFSSIQQAVDFASPWDTIVVCEGVYEESSTPFNHVSNPVATGATNGLTITKPLKIKGAGADKVTIKPKADVATLAGATPYLRDGGGNVITVSRQSLGSTDTNEMFVDISGVTVTSGDTWAEAGIAFFGAAGRVSQSKVGPLKVAKDADELAAHPHGWGIVKTGVIEGAGAGTVDTQLTVADTEVSGYQTGGILFDGAKGADGAPTTTVRTGIAQHGYVTGTVVTGSRSTVFPQTGIAWTSGFDGFAKTSRVTDNFYGPDPTKSYGLRLTDAGTDKSGALTASRIVSTGNGWAVFNGTADGSAARTGAPFVASSSYVGPRFPVSGGPANPATGAEAISGSGSVTLPSRLSSAPATVPTSYGAVADEAPSAELVDPLDGLEVGVGETVAPLVRASDDFAVTSATLLANGEEVGTVATAPYLFSWTATAAYAGKDVALTTVVTDSSGRKTTSAPLTVKVAGGPVVEPPTPPTPPTTPVKPTVKVTAVKRQPNKGTVVLTVQVNTAGTVRLAGGRVVSAGATATTAGTVKIRVAAKGKYRKILVRTGRIKAPVRITVTAKGGTAVTKRTVTLRKKR